MIKSLINYQNKLKIKEKYLNKNDNEIINFYDIIQRIYLSIIENNQS